MKTKSIKIISLIITAIVLISCVVVPGSAVSIEKDLKMVVLGDSVAYGAYVPVQDRFGDILAAKLTTEGFNVDYVNYAIPKYDTRSVWYDLNEETYAHDNNRYVAELGAKDMREGISYEDFIGDVATSDIVILHLGENDMAAAFYKLRGYDDYYEFYGDEINIPKIQKDINEGKVSGIYTLNSLKIKRVKAEFEQRLRTYLDKDIKRIQEVNPDAQIIVCDMFNPYLNAATYMTYMFDLMKAVPLEALGLLKATDVYDFFNKFAALTNNYNTLIQLMNVMIPGLTGKDMDHCAAFDLSSLTTTQKILYKVSYLRCEKACVEMYDIANEAIPEIVEANGVTLCALSKTNVNEHMAPDGAHPSKEGHEIIADALYNVIDFSKWA